MKKETKYKIYGILLFAAILVVGALIVTIPLGYGLKQ